MTRIVSGRFAGRRLVTPPGDATRPTAEKVRAAVGNALAAAGAIEGVTVLDLYAGSGALGLELLSRGAARVVLVERARAAQQAIRANIAALDPSNATLVAVEALAFARTPGEPFHLIVADPPYAEPNEAVAAVLTALIEAGRIAPGADIIIERSVRDGDFPWPAPLAADRSRRYGDTLICYGHAP